MPLNDYLMQVESFMRDRREVSLNTDDLIRFINRARRDVAIRTQCIRRLPPISGAIETITVTSSGSGYTNPTAQVTPPDFPGGTNIYPAGAQAIVGSVQVIAGQIASVGVTFGGSGYFQPAVTISDPTGTGAVAVPQMQPLMLLNPFQEIYNFSDIPIATFPGVQSVYSVLSMSVIFNNYRYPVLERPFTYYQAYVRVYPDQYYYVPFIYAQFGQGAGGSLYVYPLPNQSYQMELDCLCLPWDLQTDQDYEAIPDPWRDAVPFYAAHLAALELQNANTARMYYELFRERVNVFSSGARPRLLTLGRW